MRKLSRTGRMSNTASLGYREILPIEDHTSLKIVPNETGISPVDVFESDVFKITTRGNDTGRVIMIGRSNRKNTTGYLNIPIGAQMRERLRQQIVGSLAMGVSGLLEWALAELERKQIALEMQAKP